MKLKSLSHAASLSQKDSSSLGSQTRSFAFGNPLRRSCVPARRP
jgi:hypothetical protein